jgi:signal-transduction protein with cAMP-binding, CBS, and nucleotidyltransferase domain
MSVEVNSIDSVCPMIRLQDLLDKAASISEDELRAMERLIPDGVITPDNIAQEEAEIDDYIQRTAARNSQESSSRLAGEEPLLQDYTEDDFEQRDTAQTQRASQVAEDEICRLESRDFLRFYSAYSPARPHP